MSFKQKMLPKLLLEEVEVGLHIWEDKKIGTGGAPGGKIREVEFFLSLIFHKKT